MAEIEIESAVTEKWQTIVDIMARVLQVPAGLIMRTTGPHIEVFVASRTDGNPYHPGDKECLAGSGLYCETVIRTRERLLVPNAPADPLWKNNPDIKLNMISYLGLPIVLPDGEVFGTICVLDNKENHYNELYEQLVLEFRGLIETQLRLAYQNQSLAELNLELEQRIGEIGKLRRILPICSYCKSVRDDEGYWHAVDSYFREHTGTRFTHGLCLDCMKKHYPEEYAEDPGGFDSLQSG